MKIYSRNCQHFTLRRMLTAGIRLTHCLWFLVGMARSVKGGTPYSYPSMIPSDYPSVAPTETWTPHPADYRSGPSAPNPLPLSPIPATTRQLTPFPTPRVVTPPAPTNRPTPKPSPRPTDRPTRRPTESPTKRPTERPTRKPTPAPTDRPTRKPTPTPTRKPTFSPTKKPTPQPSRQPSSLPTRVPTTPRPTPTGTLWPTITPTMFPTDFPTKSPEPSPRPSGVTGEPTKSPQPTTSPSDEPSPFPTTYPSSQPSLPLQSQLIEAIMSLAPWTSSYEITGQDIFTWEKVTGDHIRKHILRADIEPEMEDLAIFTNIVGQLLPTATTTKSASSTSSNSPSSNRRYLQESDSPRMDALIVRFDVQVLYRSVGTDHDLPSYIFSAWDTPMDRDEYIRALATESGKLDGIEEVRVEVEGFVPPDGGKKPINIAVIIGAAVGGAALVFLVAFFLLKRGSGKEFEEHRESTTAPESTSKIAVSTEIVVEPQDDISTLGDPMFVPGGMHIGALEKDEVTASVGDDYDYAKQYRVGRNPAPASIASTAMSRDRLLSSDGLSKSSLTSYSKIGQMGDSLFADDSSFEQQFAELEDRFDVVAPAGKLGMVIDTPNGGVPVVHAIKDTSVLADRVRVGDRLVSVDGEDCTTMTAMQVSKLISLKSEKPARVLMFVRTRANTPEEP